MTVWLLIRQFFGTWGAKLLAALASAALLIGAARLDARKDGEKEAKKEASDADQKRAAEIRRDVQRSRDERVRRPVVGDTRGYRD